MTPYLVIAACLLTAALVVWLAVRIWLGYDDDPDGW